MDLNDLKDLELYFADHFDTVLFPVLAEKYLSEGDFERAHHVSEIGLDHHPDSVPGLFIEAKTYLAEGNKRKAEGFLKRVIHLDPGHYNAHVLLADVETELGRSDTTLRTLFNRILEMDSGNEKAREWLAKSFEPPTRGELETIRLSPQLATFTLMAVLKGQKLYEQALEVLALMSQKEGSDTERIEKERDELFTLIDERKKR